MQAQIRSQDLQTLFRAREILHHLESDNLGSAIERARDRLLGQKSRRQYLQEMLPAAVAHAIPNSAETFEVECANRCSFSLQAGWASLLWQVVALEGRQRTRAVKIVHHNGFGKREYWL